MAIDATVFSSTLGSARAVEIFLQALLTRSAEYAASRNAKTMTVLHLYVFCMNGDQGEDGSRLWVYPFYMETSN